MKKAATVKTAKKVAAKKVATKVVEVKTDARPKVKATIKEKVIDALVELVAPIIVEVETKPLTFIESMVKELTPVTLNGGRVIYKGENDLVLEIVNGKLFNKGILREGMRIKTATEVGTVVMVSDSKAIMHTSTDHIISRTSEVEIVDPSYKTEVVETETVVVKVPANPGRKQLFDFNGGTYSKSVLVREIVAKYVNDNPKTTLAKLEEVFACKFMGSLGILKELSVAKKLSGTGTPRYFFKPEMLVKVGNDTVAVCNQMTSDRIAMIIKLIEPLNYVITEQK